MAGHNLVVVVDDDPVVIHLVEKTLERANVRVAATSSASGALSLLHENTGDVALLLLDLAMPGTSGFELAQQVRAQPGLADLPVVALTANYGPEMRDQIDAAGINEVIEKPFKTERLIELLRRYGVEVE